MKYKLIEPNAPYNGQGFKALGVETDAGNTFQKCCPFAPDLVVPGTIQGGSVNVIPKPCGEYCTHFKVAGTTLEITCGAAKNYFNLTTEKEPENKLKLV